MPKGTSSPVDPLAAFNALQAEPAPLTDGAARCGLNGCNGIVKSDYVFEFEDAEGATHRIGLCPNKARHAAAIASGEATKKQLANWMQVVDRAVAQNAA